MTDCTRPWCRIPAPPRERSGKSPGSATAQASFAGPPGPNPDVRPARGHRDDGPVGTFACIVCSAGAQNGSVHLYLVSNARLARMSAGVRRSRSFRWRCPCGSPQQGQRCEDLEDDRDAGQGVRPTPSSQLPSASRRRPSACGVSGGLCSWSSAASSARRRSPLCMRRSPLQ